MKEASSDAQSTFLCTRCSFSTFTAVWDQTTSCQPGQVTDSDLTQSVRGNHDVGRAFLPWYPWLAGSRSDGRRTPFGSCLCLSSPLSAALWSDESLASAQDSRRLIRLKFPPNRTFSASPTLWQQGVCPPLLCCFTRCWQTVHNPGCVQVPPTYASCKFAVGADIAAVFSSDVVAVEA